MPITIAANFLRVLALVLIAYYGGIDQLDGVVHDLTGIGLFIVALVLLFLFDGFLSLCIAATRPLLLRCRPAGAQERFDVELGDALILAPRP